MSKALDALRGNIDRKAYRWLEETTTEYETLAIIHQAVAEGESPDAIRDAIARTCSAYDGEYADLCRSAARHLHAMKEKA